MNPSARILISLAVTAIVLSASASADIPRLINVLKGTNPLDQLGWNCEGIGDINGDSLGDFIVCQERNPEKMMVYLGGPHPFDVPPVLTIPNYNNPQYVGDVDCDGTPDFFAEDSLRDTFRLYLGMESLNPNDYVDFLFGQYNAPYLVSTGGDNDLDGIINFWLGSTTGDSRWDTIYGYDGCSFLDTIPDYKLIKIRNPDNMYRTLSRTMCSDCDLNGDSVPDIIYGQPTSYDTYPGRVCVTWGGTNISTSPDIVFYAPGMGAIDDPQFGSDLACPGDISGDGIDDLWVRQGGRNYVYYGGRPFDTIPDLVLDYSYTDRVTMIGDINDDGWNDIMLIYTQNYYSQIAFIYCGPEMDTIIDVVYREIDIKEVVEDSLVGSVEKVGADCSWIGDADGDGIDDILVNGTDATARGWMFVFGGWHDPIVDVNENITDPIPSKLELRQNYPNPFNSGTTIEFALPRAGYTEIKIFNLLGEEVAEPLRQYLSVGEHRIVWDGLDKNRHPAATGIYFYQISSGDYVQARKMILLK